MGNDRTLQLILTGRLSLLLVAAITLSGCATSSTPGGTGIPASSAPVSGTIQRALILGGGGPVGRAWEVGILKGLADAGVDVSQADLVVGTSSGAILGTQLRSGKMLNALYNVLIATASTPAAPAGEPGFDANYAQQTQQLIRTATELTPAIRIEVGQRALAAPKVISEDQQVKAITQGLGGDIHSWPSQPLKITAGDVMDGTVRYFDSTQGVPIERAVAASNALPGQVAPITIGGRRYMDGFVGGTNLESAAGAKIILLLITQTPGPRAQPEMERARSSGSQLLPISPDADALTAMGPNNQDLTKRAPAVLAGARQGAVVAAQVKKFWAAP